MSTELRTLTPPSRLGPAWHTAAPPPGRAAGRRTPCDLRVATGPRGKVYEKLFADMRNFAAPRSRCARCPAKADCRICR